MNPSTNALLQNLADKLGVTFQYLWLVLVNGNRQEGYIYLFYSVLLLALAYTGYRLFKHGSTADYDGEGYMVVGGLMGAASIAAFFGTFFWAVMGITNPGYGALYDLLQHVK